MNEEIFRKKNLERMNSPEDLNEYIRASNPGVWLLLIAVIFLLAGFCLWGIFGHVETVIKTEATVEQGVVSCTVRDEKLNAGMLIRIDNEEYAITDVDYAGKSGEMICNVYAQADIPDGLYDAEIVTEQINAISFLLN